MAPRRHGHGNRKRKMPPKRNKKNKFSRPDTKQNPPTINKIPDKISSNAIESEESSSEEETNPYQELVSSLKNDYQKLDDDDDNDDDDDDDSDEDELEDSLSDDSSEEEVSDEECEQNVAEGNLNGEGNSELDEDIDDDDEEADNDDDDHNFQEDESDDEDKETSNSDPFVLHFGEEISEECIDQLSQSKWNKSDMKIASLGKCTVRTLKDLSQKPEIETDLRKLHVKQSLCNEVYSTNKKFCSNQEALSPLQLMVMKIINQYQDLYYPCRTPESGEHIRLMYCLHALNHVLKTRKQVLAHNSKLKVKGNEDKEYRDQGLTRPKVLMLLPFRESALRVVNIMISLLKSGDKGMVSSKARFYEEFQEDNSDQKKGLKPEDYEATFTGSTDDHFRIGLGVAKKTLKLYTQFYAADILITSPLGLRTIIGSEGDKERDYDFLNSIEMLILDQADVLLMQNWDHVLHIMKHLHLQPKESHGTDFSRARMWALNGWNKYYRQTMIFSSVSAPQLVSLFNKHCLNSSGKITVHRRETMGTISQVVTQLPQVFHKISCNSYSNLADDRFNFFVKKILPTHKDPVLSQTLIYVPSYFDYVRLRNYFVKEDLSFVYISEYTKDKEVFRARNLFYHKTAHFLLYTERIHFYRRFKLRGIRHIVFYEMPLYPHFYSELCNMLLETHQENSTCTVLYSQYDAQKLSEVVGTDRATHMINSSKNVHMFVSGE